MNRISAIFDDRLEAEAVVADLRRLGVREDQISVIAQHEGDAMGDFTAARDYAESKEVVSNDASDVAQGAAKGAVAGLGVGTLFGLTAALIPGVGPFITGGFWALTMGSAASALLSGAIVGTTTGAIAGALAKVGYDEKEAEYYGTEVEKGGILVAVETDSLTIRPEEIRAVLNSHHARLMPSY